MALSLNQPTQQHIPIDTTATAPAPFNWRAHLRIHPAADLFPLMSESELKEHAEDIKANGLCAPLGFWSKDGNSLLDGRNRLDALALLGLLYETEDHHLGIKKWTVGKGWSDRPAGHLELAIDTQGYSDGDPYAIALSLNVHRRHLTHKQKDELVAKLIKANPGKSNRQIAAQAKVRSHPHVGKIRTELEKAGDVETVSTSIDTKGRKQPAKHKGKATASKSEPTAPEVQPIAAEGSDTKIPEQKKPTLDNDSIARADVAVQAMSPKTGGNDIATEASAEARKATVAAGDGDAPTAGRPDYSIPEDGRIPHFLDRTGAA
jgi:hypothetical protein